MTFRQSELLFEPGLFANRSRRGSKRRWVDGNLVRFRDGLPAQVGGWEALDPGGVALSGSVRGCIAWRPNNQNGRYLALGSQNGAYRYDGADIANITPTGFVAGEGTTILGAGFGSDRFGVGTFGTERESTGNLLEAANWTFDMFGETLLGCFTVDGVIYEYTEGEDVRFALISGAPSARAICVSDERHVFAFGADGVPGRVRWSDREDRAVWENLSTNRAGSYDLQVTSPFQCGKRVRGAVLGWTRTEVFRFEPLNSALVYSRERISTEAGACGPHAVAVVTDNQGEAAYWIGRDNFFMYDGLVRTLDCDLRDHVFGDINLAQAAKFHARTNTAFDEVVFWYVSADATEIDRAVIYNYLSGAWSKADVARLAWEDSGVFDKPLAVDVSGTLYEHESGETADGDAMGSFILSHPIMVGVGEQFAEVNAFWPDMEPGSADCSVSFICRDWPGADPTTYGPYEFAIGDEKIDLAFAAREFQVRIDGGNGHWELGIPQIAVQGGGLRG